MPLDLNGETRGDCPNVQPGCAYLLPVFASFGGCTAAFHTGLARKPPEPAKPAPKDICGSSRACQPASPLSPRRGALLFRRMAEDERCGFRADYGGRPGPLYGPPLLAFQDPVPHQESTSLYRASRRSVRFLLRPV